MTAMKTIDDLDVAGRRVLVRVDFNVPMKDGRVADATRVERSAATIVELARRGARVVVVSHLGRPKGQPKPELTLRPVAEALAAAAGRPVGFAADCVGPEAEAAVAALTDGGIVLLENLRFHAGEEANDPGFARRLAALADLYVGDAFSCAHRAHASVEAVARLLPAAAGRLMQAELEALASVLERPARPVCAIVGGAKVSTKMEVLGHLADKVDVLAIGGGMANTFLLADGIEVGRSLAERDMVEAARAIAERTRRRGAVLLLPVDGVVAAELKEGAASRTVGVAMVPADAMILDVGPATVAAVTARLEACRTVLWNGPFGAFEIPPFDAATVAVARAVARLTAEAGLVSVAGGGDTVAALAHAGVVERFSYVSTAGGAFLEWLEGKALPGVEVLRTA